MVRRFISFEEAVVVRFFVGDRSRRAVFLKRYPDRFPNDSSFIRAACQFFSRHLEEELLKERRKV